MSTIVVQNLCKDYCYYEKQPGFRHSVRNLVARKTLLRHAVQNISFEIEEGETVAFLGPNGAGKTTTLKMLSGILYPTSGHAEVMGYVPWERKKAFKMKFAIVLGQKGQLWWDLPASESFGLYKAIYELDEQVYQRRIEELSEMLDVKHLMNVQVRKLSLGERMKMELIAALIHQPSVLFLDEPTIGLDLTSQVRVRKFLKYYSENHKTTIILTSHYVRDIEDLCHRAILISEGAKIYDGTLQRLHEFVNRRKVIKMQLSEEITPDILANYGVVHEVAGVSASVEVQREHVNECVATILRDLPVVDINIEEVPLEHAIELLYQGGNADANQI